MVRHENNGLEFYEGVSVGHIVSCIWKRILRQLD